MFLHRFPVDFAIPLHCTALLLLLEEDEVYCEKVHKEASEWLSKAFSSESGKAGKKSIPVRFSTESTDTTYSLSCFMPFHLAEPMQSFSPDHWSHR